MTTRLALYGEPGAGKSTSRLIVVEELTALGATTLVLKLAEPLYQIQQLIYTMCRRSIPARYQQDGALLNDLGAHLRRINPDVLTNDFADRVLWAEHLHPEAVLLCDDMRAPDTDALVALGFRLVKVTAPAALRRARKESRGDLTVGAERHSTETTLVTHSSDFVLNNDGSFDHLRTEIRSVLEMVMK